MKAGLRSIAFLLGFLTACSHTLLKVETADAAAPVSESAAIVEAIRSADCTNTTVIAKRYVAMLDAGGVSAEANEAVAGFLAGCAAMATPPAPDKSAELPSGLLNGNLQDTLNLKRALNTVARVNRVLTNPKSADDERTAAIQALSLAMTPIATFDYWLNVSMFRDKLGSLESGAATDSFWSMWSTQDYFPVGK